MSTIPSRKPNQLSRNVARFQSLPAALRPWLTSLLLGKVVPLVGTAGLRFEEIRPDRVVVSIRNQRKVQNHIKGVHAAAMALLAETATGFCVGMNVPDDKLPLIKTLKVDYLKRSVGDMRAVAQLRPEQIQQILTQDKGEVTVPVTITDQSGQEPIQCEMVWAWVPKKRD
jgi:acyl-coenzyme A thioesterase PaaI-like protein